MAIFRPPREAWFVCLAGWCCSDEIPESGIGIPCRGDTVGTVIEDHGEPINIVDAINDFQRRGIAVRWVQRLPVPPQAQHPSK